MNLRREVSDALVKRGFERNDRLHRRRIDESFSFWVDTGPLGKRVDVAPFVGIRHEGIQRLFVELKGLEPSDWVGTVGANVGYVLGDEYRVWEPPTPVETVLESIEAGLETLRPFLTLETLGGAWKIRGARTPSWQYKEIVLMVLLGETSTALALLDVARGVFCKHDSELCEDFKAFEARLRKRLEDR